MDLLVANFRLRIEPMTEAQVRIARQAYLDFGRGNRPAGLDSGDCFAYALAKATGEPLLFEGDDLARTDVRPCPASTDWSEARVAPLAVAVSSRNRAKGPPDRASRYLRVWS